MSIIYESMNKEAFLIIIFVKSMTDHSKVDNVYFFGFIVDKSTLFYQYFIGIRLYFTQVHWD